MNLKKLNLKKETINAIRNALKGTKTAANADGFFGVVGDVFVNKEQEDLYNEICSYAHDIPEMLWDEKTFELDPNGCWSCECEEDYAGKIFFEDMVRLGKIDPDQTIIDMIVQAGFALDFSDKIEAVKESYIDPDVDFFENSNIEETVQFCQKRYNLEYEQEVIIKNYLFYCIKFGQNNQKISGWDFIYRPNLELRIKDLINKCCLEIITPEKISLFIGNVIGNNFDVLIDWKYQVKGE